MSPYMHLFKKPLFKKQQRGFTLIEVLLALAMTALLMTLLSTGMYVVARDWNENTDSCLLYTSPSPRD